MAALPQPARRSGPAGPRWSHHVKLQDDRPVKAWLAEAHDTVGPGAQA